MTIKKTLQAYYAKQGLTGKHLRKALQYDMRCVRKAPVMRQTEDLCHRLDWAKTRDGYAYWLERACKTGK